MSYVFIRGTVQRLAVEKTFQTDTKKNVTGGITFRSLSGATFFAPFGTFMFWHPAPAPKRPPQLH